MILQCNESTQIESVAVFYKMNNFLKHVHKNLLMLTFLLIHNLGFDIDYGFAILNDVMTLWRTFTGSARFFITGLFPPLSYANHGGIFYFCCEYKIFAASTNT